MPRAKKPNPPPIEAIDTIANPFGPPSVQNSEQTVESSPKTSAADSARFGKIKAESHSELLAALKFAKLAQSDIGPAYVRHCVLYDGWLFAHDGILSVGVQTHEQVQLAPHTDRLIAALERASGTVALTQTGTGLQVRAGKLRAVIPCLDLGTMPPIFADPACAPLSNTFRDALAACAPLVSDGAETTALAGILLGEGNAVATNRHVLIEYWHGHSMPPVLMPKVAAKELLRIKKPLKAFGVSANMSSITFYFEDDSWLKTQLYDPSAFPKDYSKLLEPGSTMIDTPKGFFEAIKTLEPFVDERGGIYFLHDALGTDPQGVGTTYEFKGLAEQVAFNVKYLRLMESLATRIDFGDYDPKLKRRRSLVFYGDSVRGAIAPMKIDGTTESDEATYIAAVHTAAAVEVIDAEDIPF